jgi:hypothetical protein
VVREKPFLVVDAKGRYGIRVPALRTNSSGVTWHGGKTPGATIPLAKFYIAKPSDTATAMNAELAKGKNLLLTPGIYELENAIHVTRANTVVYGLGFATLKPVKGTAALTTADVDGVIVAGLLIDAGETKSPVLMEVGPEESKASHAKNPICLEDVFFRVGGAKVGRAGVNLRINSNNTIVDHTWIWRADHGGLRVGKQCEREWAGGEWQQRDRVWAVRGAPPGVSGVVEWEWRTNVFLSVGNSIRSPGPEELYERSGDEWMGVVQGSG